MPGLNEFLILSAVLFCLSIAGIFLNRKNLLIILMCIELMLLSVNTNFIAFSYFNADIGLAILVVLFRGKNTINVDDLDALKG